MGLDCVFVAENREGVTIQDLQGDISLGKFPGGRGVLKKTHDFFECRYFTEYPKYEIELPSFAYCQIELVSDLIVIYDGCRYNPGFRDDYKVKMLQYLKGRFGGRVGLFANDSWIFADLESVKEVVEVVGEEWPQAPPPGV